MLLYDQGFALEKDLANLLIVVHDLTDHFWMKTDNIHNTYKDDFVDVEYNFER